LFCTDVTYRKGKDVPLKGIVDEAVANAPAVKQVVVLRRGAAAVSMTAGRDMTWQDFLAKAKGQDDAHVECESNEPAYILATSGTTAKPKLAVHTHGGYQVYVYSMAKWMFGLRPDDVWWSTSDIGWVVGHSYIVFAPLLVGCATIAYEGALGERVRLAEAKALFCTDVTYRKGKDVPLKGIVDEAVSNAPAVEQVVVLRRGAAAVSMTAGRDITWQDFLAKATGHDDAHVECESNEPAYILATSGTTAKPKLAVHTHGGYQVYVYSMAKWMFALRPDDVWWSTSDIGWVVGHSYIVFAPLLVGCATIAYEGALDHPNAETFYAIIERDRVTGVFTSPTAARLLMRYGTEPARKHDLATLERVFCAGEVLNAPAWEWLQKEALQDKVPVIDHYWQTETGGPVVGNPYGIAQLPIKPGSGAIPLAGIEAAVVDADGKELGPNEKGIFVIKRPFPGLTARLWAEPERYARDYWERVPGKTVYFTGDAASIDEDGYVWFSGRADEIIKIADHRIGTIEVETAFLRHPAVAEAGVTGRPDELRGQVISAFVVLKQGHQPSEKLRQELIATVRSELGPLAVIGELNFVDMLPKTRSGKIMRRVLKAVILDKDPGDISTIEDEGSVEEAREAWTDMKREVTKT
ncbi:MAG TPA: AMP-binding protein, partial [Candidatus Limnocylindria bacterium]